MQRSSNDKFYDRSGSYKGYMSNNKFYDRSGSYMGYVQNGSVYDRSGSYIGRYNGSVPLAVVAMVYYYGIFPLR